MMVKQREEVGVTEDDRRHVLLVSRLRNIQHVSCTSAVPRKYPETKTTNQEKSNRNIWNDCFTAGGKEMLGHHKGEGDYIKSEEKQLIGLFSLL